MNANSMENGEISVENSLDRQHAHVENQEFENPTPNQSNYTDIIKAMKTAEKASMNPTHLEVSCWSRHPNATALGAFVLFTSLAMTVGILTVYFTSPKPSETCQRTFHRTMKSSLNFSSLPRSVAVGDFNNDQQMDIVVTNSGTDTIGIFLANGNGTFADQQTNVTGSGSRPYSIVISDFNQDNNLDIAVANYGTNSIGIFLGNGNGTFTNQTLFSLGSSHPLFITVGDVNNDNRTDILVANYGTNTVGILLGYGNGSFQDQTTYFTAYDSIPYSLAIGDFNKDNQLDIAVANYGTNNIGIFFGYGNGTFTNQTTYTTTPYSNPSSIAVGDFNNDNHLDIVVANNGTGNVGLFLGNGNGTFLTQTTYSIGSNSYPQYISVGDLNKDNALDIVVVDSINDYVHVLPGYGNGSFMTITTYDTVSQSRPFSVSVADFNNNNQSDMVVINYGTNNVLILIDYFIKPSARQTTYQVASPNGIHSVAVSDFNNDRILDIASGSGDSIVILIGLGGGTFGRQTIYSTGYGWASQYLCVGDLNNDSRMDIVLTNTGVGSVSVFLGHGDGTFANMTTYSTGNGSNPCWLALGDFNHDNRLDIVSANKGSNTVGILLGNGSGTFRTVVTYPTLYSAALYSVAVGNINNDTHLDLIVATGSGFVIIFLGLGNGSFISPDGYSTSDDASVVFSVALADFNSDNYLDVAVADTFDDNVGVLLGNNDGTFAAQTTYFTGSGSQPYYVIVDDFNNDNISDIAATNLDRGEVVIFYGSGNGSFELARRYSTGLGSGPYGITAADLNNDTHLEIVVALWGTGDIAVLTEYDAAEFVNQTEYSTGSAPQPFSVAVGDFNKDNRSDIVVANSGTDNLGILLGSINGTFGTNITYPIGTDFHPQYVIMCDINKDNQLDIVSVNSKNNSISIIMGYENGTFAEQLIYSTGDSSYPYAVAADDFNNDNRLDLVIANEGSDSIGIFLGFNYTSFLDQVTYSRNNSLEPLGNVVSDFNNDTYLDVAVTFGLTDEIGILLGYGNGSFSDIMIYSIESGSQPGGLGIGDFNNDGRSDIVVANGGTNKIGVLLGYGNGSFASMMTYSNEIVSAPEAVATGDLNNDGQLDIVVANYANNVGVLLGYGNGTFSVLQTYSTGHSSISYDVTIADFNNDGNLDIAVTYFGTNNVGVLLGYGNGTFRNQLTFSTGANSQPASITVGDFNRDNQLDIATANWNNGNVGILLGYGNGTFANIITYPTGVGSEPNWIRVGDFNNDNISDIAVANTGTNNVVVLFGFGDGSFLLGKPHSTGIGSTPVTLAIGDFNNDSRLDFAVTNVYANNIGVFLGYGSDPFGSITTYSTGDGSKPYSVAVSDLNHDGWSDVITANYGTNNLGILLASGNDAFNPIMTYSTGMDSAPYCVALADFNNDAHMDIVVTNSETDNIAILLGYGNGTFTIPVIYSTGDGSRPYIVAVGDFNNDDISDLVIANSGTSNIFFFVGYGNGTFGNETSYSLGYGYLPYSVAVTDLNQDGWMDIVIACYGTDHIETLIQMC